MATCTQFTTTELRALTYKLQCCLGNVAKQYARFRAAGRIDLAKCKEYDLKYLTLAYNSLNCVKTLDQTFTEVNVSNLAGGSQKLLSYNTGVPHNLTVGQLVNITGFSNSAWNVTSTPISAIYALNTFVIQVPNDTAAEGGGGTVTAIVNNSISCDDIESILNKVKSICDCDCCKEPGKNTYTLSYSQTTGQLTASNL